MYSRSHMFWSMFNNQLIIYPQAGVGSSVEITGALTPPKYTDEDLFKDLVKIPILASQVQGLSDIQMKLVRYRVIARLLEDSPNLSLLQKAQYMDGKATQLEHKMRATHDDDAFTSTNRSMRGSPTNA